MNINLNRLKIFTVVARTKNFSTAAKELGMTQPNLGRQMRILSEEVGMTLFVAHSRGIDLTKQGQEFFDLCQNIIGQLRQRTDLIREKGIEPEGRFNFLSGPGLLETIMGKSTLFSKKFSKLSFNFSTIVNTFQIIKNVYQLQIGKTDAAVMSETISDPDFTQRLLYNNPMRIYASPHYLQSHPIPKTLKDLQSHKVIVFAGEKLEILNKQITDDNTGSFLHPFIEVSTAPTMCTALINGAGIGCYGYHQEIMDKGLLIDVFPDMPDNIISYYYTYHKRLEGSPKVQAFYEFLKEITKVWERP